MSRHAPDTFLGHPRPLGTLFHIELWERFSFYGMQSILLIYLYYSVRSGGLGIDQGLAGSITGVYGGSVYLATILGGWLADRVLGPERTLFYSGVVVMLGHVVLALVPAVAGLIVGLVFIALGSGGVKSSASTMLGSLYEEENLRSLRDAGFSLFYLAVNIGALFGPLLTGLAQVHASFHAGFGLAAIGMAVGLWRYGRGRSALPHQPPPNPLTPAHRNRAILTGVLLLTVLALVGGGDGAGQRRQFLRRDAGHQRCGCAQLLWLDAVRPGVFQYRKTARVGLGAALSGLLRVLDAVGADLHGAGGVLRRGSAARPVWLRGAGGLGRLAAERLGAPALRLDGHALDLAGPPPAAHAHEIRTVAVRHGAGLLLLRALYALR